MTPNTRAVDFKRLEDSIEAVKQETSYKYEQLEDLLKRQNLKLDSTIENQEAQISDIRSMMSTMAQQIEFTSQRLS
jgi:2-keto-4-pentenoate hydratase/2-oxohepta-3-ene-1,7-dioic acid hydratase in catechol pathway